MAGLGGITPFLKFFRFSHYKYSISSVIRYCDCAVGAPSARDTANTIKIVDIEMLEIKFKSKFFEAN